MTDAPTASDTAPDLAGLDTAFNADQKNFGNSFPVQEAAPAPVEQAPKEKKPAQAEAKPKAVKEAPKKPWEVKAEDASAEDTPDDEAPVEEAVPAEEVPKDMKPEAETRWKELRRIEKEHKEVQPAYEKLKKEVEELRKAPVKAPDDYEELRQFRAAHDVQNTKEFKEAVTAPYQALESQLKEVAEFAKISLDDLLDATDIPNRLARAQAIKDVLSKSDQEIDPSIAEDAITTAKEIWKVYDKRNELLAKAGEIRNSMTGQEKLKTEAQEREFEQKFQEHAQEMQQKLAVSFKNTGLMDSKELVDKVLAARPADFKADPEYAVFQAQAAEMVVPLIEKINEYVGEIKTLKAAAKARARSGTSNGVQAPSQRPAVEDEDWEVSFDREVKDFNAGKR